ncbi:hypothetical protein OGAPHI_003121 [Ogataea philodendri]|uniref:PCI domain-containing protein n=1 Tax=Ogataea philodendri TaxID=1378263 RepID=A0A9P8P8T2_9ASCO|nr:uncharacterized protein OGAPHI_003121 [Ogataea philodendri]KAH3667472.1 hypothetical protein OGAPHI_003121 [Ogataea philodendri]
MSDWDDDMYDDEEEELSFEEDANESVEETNTDVESRYFWGKELRQDEKLKEALEVFEDNIRQNDSNEYTFKSIKQAIKVSIEMGDFSKISGYIDLFLQQLPQVGTSYAESSFSKMLHRLDRQNLGFDPKFQEQIYNKFSEYLGTRNSGNERLVIRVDLGRAGLLLNEKKYTEAREILQKLEKVVLGSSESVRSAFLLDILASEMIIAKEFVETPELRRLTKLADDSGSGIPQSKIVGTIKECCGLVAMADQEFQTANLCFQESFRAFNDCGDDRRVDVLMKYIVSNLLSESEIDPFQSSDFQGFDDRPEVVKLMEMYRYVQETDISKYNWLIKKDETLKDLKEFSVLAPFFPYVTQLLQERFVLQYLQLFKRVSFKKLQDKLEVGPDDVEMLLLRLYSEGRITDFKLDMVDKTVERIDGQILDPGLTSEDVLERLQLYQKDKLSIPMDDFGVDSQERLQEILSLRFQAEAAPSSPSLRPEMNATTMISKEVLEPLIPIRKSYESCDELLKELDDYLKYMRSTLPSKAVSKLSLLERVTVDNQNQEAEEIKQLDVASSRDHDHLIPEVLQFTMMDTLDNNDHKESGETPTEQELAAARVASVRALVSEIANYYENVNRNFTGGVSVDCSLVADGE